MIADPLLGNIPGYYGSSLMRPDEIALLIKHLPESGWMLEIGSYEGVTAALIAEQRPGAVVVCVDPFIDHDERDFRERSGGERLKNWRANRRPNQHLWIGDLQSFYGISGHTFDLVLVDGAHETPAASADLALGALLVSPGGVLAVHDYADWDSVRAATDEFLSYGAFRIVDSADSMVVLGGV